MEHLFKFCIGNVYICSRTFKTWFYKYYTVIKQYVKIRNVTYMHLKIRGEIGTDTKWDFCGIYWSVEGKYPTKDLRSVSEVWDNSGLVSSVHSLIFLHWKIPWTEETGGLQSMGLQRAGHDWATRQRGNKDLLFTVWPPYTDYINYLKWVSFTMLSDSINDAPFHGVLFPSFLILSIFFNLSQSISSSRKPSLIIVCYTPILWP